MSVIIKSPQEIESMRKGGRILALIVDELKKFAKPGVTTFDIDQKSRDLCKTYKVKPAFLGYDGFPAVVCTGIDNIAIHGIPSKYEQLSEGQTISIDMGIVYEGMYLDHAVTTGIGHIDKEAQRLLDITKLALKKAIDIAVDGNTTGDVGFVIDSIAKLAGFNVIRIMTGHGVGKFLHEDPEIPCFGQPGKGVVFKENMTVAIEPMINEGVAELVFDPNGWTTRTKDGKRSAIFEHSILIKKKKSEILTLLS